RSTFIILLKSTSHLSIKIEYQVFYITFDIKIESYCISLLVTTKGFIDFYLSLGLLTLTEHILKSSTLFHSISSHKVMVQFHLISFHVMSGFISSHFMKI